MILIWRLTRTVVDVIEYLITSIYTWVFWVCGEDICRMQQTVAVRQDLSRAAIDSLPGENFKQKTSTAALTLSVYLQKV